MTYPSQPSRSKVPLVIAVIVGLLAILGVRALTTGGGDGDSEARPGASEETRDLSGCDSPVTLAVTSSSEKAALLREMVDRFEGSEAGACIDATVTSKASGGAVEALARGWDEERDGPRPDVLTPAASSWAGILRQRTSAADRPDLVGDAELPSIAQSPLVIAMPKPMAEALGWPKKPLGWTDVLSISQDPKGWASVGKPYGAFKLGKTNPNFSTSGLHATIGTYVAATGTSSDLTAKDLADPKVQAFARGVESAVVHYGDTTLTYLSNLQAADDRGQALSYVSAAAVEEKSVLDYNLGNPTGDPATLGKHAPPKTPLVAIYPKEGTLISDSPWITLQAEWVDEGKKEASAALLKFLQAETQQQRFQEAGFRSFQGKAGSKASAANGLTASEPKVVLGFPSPGVLAQVLSSWSDQRKSARVLLVIDTSGSMSDPAGNGQTRLESAKAAAITALGQFSPRDEVALWAFSTPLDGAATPYRELVGFKPVSQNKQALTEAISILEPQGGTALYATTRAAQKVMVAQFARDRINAVVLLTDGKNEYPADTDLESLEAQLDPEDEDRAVRVFTIAYGGESDLTEVTRISKASNAAAYNAKDASSIDKVFTEVLSNF